MMKKSEKIIINSGLLLVAIMLAYISLDVVVVKTKALDGISITEFLIDEYRIRQAKSSLPYPNPVTDCRASATTLIPYCEKEFHGSVVRMPKSTIKINSFGIRDREYPFKKGPDTYRIFVVGDSFAYGYGVSNDEAFPEVMEEELNARYDTTRFEVFNLAILGLNIADEYIRLNEYLNYSPDMVIAQFCCQEALDCPATREEMENTMESRALNEEERMEFENWYTWDITTYDERCECMLEYLHLMQNMTTLAGIPLVVFEIDDYSPTLSCSNSINASNYYFTFTSTGEATYDRSYRLSRVDSHLNAKGHQRAANDLLQSIIPIINSTRPEVLS